jgi:nitrite reductase (NO-forming)
VSASNRPGPAGRVAKVQRQARASLSAAVVFAAASTVAVVVPHRTGAWFPMHLFLAGALLLAISGATQLFAVTWASGAPPSDAAATLQRSCLAVSIALLGIARELHGPAVILAAGGAGVILSLLMLAHSLLRIARSRVQRRFDAAIYTYLVAIAAGVVGCAIGADMATTGHTDMYVQLRSAHVSLNLLGLIGLVILGTLPSFAATQLRTRLSPRATARAQTSLLVFTALALVGTATGFLTGVPQLAAAGLFLYAVAIARVWTILPALGRKQLRWAGPRVLQLGAGLAWWFGVVVVVAYSAARGGDDPFTPTLITVLVVGGYAQILAGSLAYLMPVLRGGGHERLTRGFRTTRSWLGLVAANGAAIAIVAGWLPVAVAACGAWVVDTTVRAVCLRTPARGPGAPLAGIRTGDTDRRS